MADEYTYGFNKSDAQNLLSKLGEDRTFTISAGGYSPSYICQTPVGGIAARSGSTISSGTCTIYSGAGGSLASSGVTVPVYNLSTTAVAGSVYIVAVMAGGVLVAVWEDC